MLKKSILLFIFLFILPVTGFTLGLGNITVFSKLNEPLKVHIELVNSSSTRLDEIVVKNASLRTYKQANLPRPDSFSKVRFKAKKVNNGSIVIELTTKRPVREPFITFIADLKWRTGHLNREYTFLLDPPEFIQKQIYNNTSKAKKSTIKTASKKTSTKKLPVSRSPRKASHKKIDYSSVIANHADGDTYTTRRADTLWNIARKVKPGKNVTTYQTMQALYALNPRAFINSNIDLLKTGQTLKIPTQNEILQINGKPPRKESALQNSRTTTRPDSVLSKQQKTSQLSKPATHEKAILPEKTLSSEEVNNKAQLKIIPTTEPLINTPVTSKSDLILINKALQSSISTIKSLKNENEVLSEQINKLTEKLKKLDDYNQGLNDKISTITEQLDNKQNVSENSAQPGTHPVNTQELSTSKTVTNTSNSKAKPDNSNRVEIDSRLAQTGKSRSFVRELLTNPVITIALAIFTIIILILALVTIRSQGEKRKLRKEKAYLPFPDKDNIKAPHSSSEPVPVKNIKKQSDTASISALQGTDISDAKNEDDMDFFEYFEKKINSPETGTITGSNSKQSSAQTQTTDTEETAEFAFNLDISPDEIGAYEQSIAKPKPSDTTLSEIDTYLAYGNYNEAEKHLLSELQKKPSDKSLHLKLFECYTYSNKRYEFMQHAAHNIELLNADMVLRHRLENIFQQTWNERLDLSNF